MNVLAIEPELYHRMTGAAKTLYEIQSYWPHPSQFQILVPSVEKKGIRRWLENCAPFRPNIVFANTEIEIKSAHEIASICGAKLAVGFRNLSRKLDRDSASRLLDVDLFITASEFCQQTWQADYGFDIKVIPNSVDLDKFKPGPRPHSKPDQRLVLYLGRLNKSKGIQHLVHIARELKTLGPYHVAVVGRQEELPVRFKQQITNYATDNLSIHAATDKPWDWINSADILIHPCEWNEIFGKVIVEFLACGKPILASARGGIPEILSPFPDLLMKTLNPREWASRIHTLWYQLHEPEQSAQAQSEDKLPIQHNQLLVRAQQYSAHLIAEQYYQAFYSLHNPE